MTSQINLLLSAYFSFTDSEKCEAVKLKERLSGKNKPNTFTEANQSPRLSCSNVQTYSRNKHVMCGRNTAIKTVSVSKDNSPFHNSRHTAPPFLQQASSGPDLGKGSCLLTPYDREKTKLKDMQYCSLQNRDSVCLLKRGRS